ncbi:hypothetical protein PG990_000989 [Apiospora arundinis]
MCKSWAMETGYSWESIKMALREIPLEQESSSRGCEEATGLAVWPGSFMAVHAQPTLLRVKGPSDATVTERIGVLDSWTWRGHIVCHCGGRAIHLIVCPDQEGSERTDERTPSTKEPWAEMSPACQARVGSQWPPCTKSLKWPIKP